MINYNNGKIYKIEPIVEHDEDEIYVGSTTKHYLSQRMVNHRSDYKRYIEGKTKYIFSSFKLFDKYGVENCEISLIETVNANSNDELKAREKYYIQLLNCVNKNIPNRTHEEYLEYMKEYNKEYNKNNNEKIKEYMKEYTEKNKDRIKEYDNKKYICSCGSTCIYRQKVRHFASIKHQQFINETIT